VALAERDQLPHEAQHAAVALDEPPVEPGEIVVLAIGVVVAALAAQHLVAGEDHGHSLAQEQDGHEVPGLAPAPLEDLGGVRLALCAAVPGEVVVAAVAVVLAVGLVVTS
jgi:hypothetical protein